MVSRKEISLVVATGILLYAATWLAVMGCNLSKKLVWRIRLIIVAIEFVASLILLILIVACLDPLKKWIRKERRLLSWELSIYLISFLLTNSLSFYFEENSWFVVCLLVCLSVALLLLIELLNPAWKLGMLNQLLCTVVFKATAIDSKKKWLKILVVVATICFCGLRVWLDRRRARALNEGNGENGANGNQNRGRGGGRNGGNGNQNRGRGGGRNGGNGGRGRGRGRRRGLPRGDQGHRCDRFLETCGFTLAAFVAGILILMVVRLPQAHAKSEMTETNCISSLGKCFIMDSSFSEWIPSASKNGPWPSTARLGTAASSLETTTKSTTDSFMLKMRVKASLSSTFSGASRKLYGPLTNNHQQIKLRVLKPGTPSPELKEAIGMPEGASPLWLTSVANVESYGPPPLYPHLKIPALNASIPPGASLGYHPGGWDRLVDETGHPLFGDIFGVHQQEPNFEKEPVAKTKHWGDLEEEEEEELEAGIQSVDSISGTPTGAETPERPFYQVLEETEEPIARGTLVWTTHSNSYVVNICIQDKIAAKRVDLLQGQKSDKEEASLQQEEYEIMSNILPSKFVEGREDEKPRSQRRTYMMIRLTEDTSLLMTENFQ